MRRPMQTRSAGLFQRRHRRRQRCGLLAVSAAHSAVLVPATAAESANQPRAHPRACAPPRRLQAHHAGGGDGDGGGAGSEVPERGWVGGWWGGGQGRAAARRFGWRWLAVGQGARRGLAQARRPCWPRRRRWRAATSAAAAAAAGAAAAAACLPGSRLPRPAACPAPAACRGLRGRLHVRGAWCRPAPAGCALGPSHLLSSPPALPASTPALTAPALLSCSPPCLDPH